MKIHDGLKIPRTYPNLTEPRIRESTHHPAYSNLFHMPCGNLTLLRCTHKRDRKFNQNVWRNGSVFTVGAFF